MILKSLNIYKNAESLIRWFHPEKGYISPMDFIPIAEKRGIIDEISEYSLDKVFQQKSTWNKSGYKLPKISINVSAISFSKSKFFRFIKLKLEKYNLKPREIVLELTESSFESYQGEIKSNIEKLRELGVEVAMDDFGTGYSSLARLKDLQLDYLKLDRSFITALFDENGQKMIEPLIALAKILGKSVIAEGIETQEQYDVLRTMGCQYGQGYFLARPMPAEDLIRY